MTIPTSEFDENVTGTQLGAHGVDNLVTHAERICTYEQQRIELNNDAILRGLEGEYCLLLQEEQRLEERLQKAPPAGDVRRLRYRAIYYWSVTVILIVSGFFATQLSFDPFRLGWKSWLYCIGITVLTPFLVERLLEFRNMEKALKALTAAATVAALVGLMLLAAIRGNLLAEEIHKDEAPAVVIDDTSAQPEPQNNFYDSTTGLLRAVMLLLAFATELGAGLVLREALRSVPDSSEDWEGSRKELIRARRGMVEIARQVSMLRNEPAIFANGFWRDFYRAMLSNAARSAMTKLFALILGVSLLAAHSVHAEGRLNMVVAIDLSRSVSGVGPDAKSDFEKNIDGVTRLLSGLPLGTRLTVIAITDHSFAQPYILMQAHVPDDAGYFGERLTAARNQLVRTWKLRSAHLEPHFPQTDILGALQLAAQIFAQHPDAGRKTLILFSDMRQSTPELNLEPAKIVPSFSAVAKRCGRLPDLHGVEVEVLGVDGAGKSDAYWQSLRGFWEGYIQTAGTLVGSYSVLWQRPQSPPYKRD